MDYNHHAKYFAGHSNVDGQLLIEPKVHKPMRVGCRRGPAPLWSAYDAGDAIAAADGDLNSAIASSSAETLREVSCEVGGASFLPLRAEPLARMLKPNRQRLLVGDTMTANDLERLKDRQLREALHARPPNVATPTEKPRTTPTSGQNGFAQPDAKPKP